MKCIDEPISFFRLERYNLGELSPEETSQIHDHLTRCEACKKELATIAEDDSRALPALPTGTTITTSTKTETTTATTTTTTTANVSFLRRAWPIAGALAIAAAMLVFLSKPQPEVQGDGVRVKGDGVSFGLVRDDETMFEEGGASYHDGDRFKVVITCSPGSRTRADVVVWENGEPSFPLSADDVACGNKVALPGAFRATGIMPMRVCLLTSDAGTIDRDHVKRVGPSGTPDAMCKMLLPRP